MGQWDTLPGKEVIERTVSNLQGHGFSVETVSSSKEAFKKIQELIPKGKEVMTGSSTTLNEIGFSEYLQSGTHPWIDLHSKISSENDEAKRSELRRKATAAQYFVASANALTEDGCIVAADMSGSRVGAFPFSAEHLILVVSTQKITKDVPAAFERVREYVLPLESKRALEAYGMSSQTAKWVVLEREIVPGRVTVILVSEKLGF